MEIAMPVIEAEAELKSPVPDNRVYDVILAVTGSEEAAADALCDRMAMRLRRGETFQG